MSRASYSYYFLTISILPQKEGLNIVKIIGKISDLLVDYPSATSMIHKFKISGEAKVIAIIKVSDINGLERILGKMIELGPVDIDSQPIILYETFAKNMRIAADLCKPSRDGLAKEGIFWLEFNIEYHGRTFEEFIQIWKKEAETVLSRRSKGEVSLELFKCLAQRKVHVMFNIPDPAQLDLLSFQLPIMVENGVNIRVQSKGLQYLDDYMRSMGTFRWLSALAAGIISFILIRLASHFIIYISMNLTMSVVAAVLLIIPFLIRSLLVLFSKEVILNLYIRQGCVLSPYMFNLYAEDIMRNVRDDISRDQYDALNIGGHVIPEIRYADDTVLLSTSLNGMDNLLTSTQMGVSDAGHLACDREVFRKGVKAARFCKGHATE